MQSLLPHFIHVKGGPFEYKFKDRTLDLNLKDFYISPFQVTQELWIAVMGEQGKHDIKAEGPRLPVDRSNWLNAITFCNLLSEKTGLEKVYQIEQEDVDIQNSSWRQQEDPYGSTKVIPHHNKGGFRLPTEAEWLYAAQGGNINHKLSPCLEEIAWFDENSFRLPHPVGLKAPNILGIYDMLGNVMEWCWDGRDTSFYEMDYLDPTTNVYHDGRIQKGGSWQRRRDECHAEHQFTSNRYAHYYQQGLRLVKTKT